MEKEKDRRLKDSRGEASRSLFPISSPPFSNGGLNYILHTVSKFDTLAGVAIKYGVEVADIKRLNGLVTDFQMFALKTLQIPLPGRHPPSPILSTPQRPSSSEQTAYNRRHSDFFESFQSLKLKSSSERKVSPAMSNLRGYYGLGPPVQNLAASEGFEMSLYRKGGAHYLEDGPFTGSSPIYNPPLSVHRKSKSAANGFHSDKGDLTDPLLSRDNDQDRWIEKLIGRHQKSDADFTSRTPVKLLKEDNSNGSAISAITGKGLALRPKSNTKTVSGGVDGESYGQGDSLLNDSVNGVRKSLSTPCLQDSDNGSMSSIWPTSKWNLKPDFQGLSSASIARPIFDGLPKPIGRKNKAALD